MDKYINVGLLNVPNFFLVAFSLSLLILFTHLGVMYTTKQKVVDNG